MKYRIDVGNCCVERRKWIQNAEIWEGRGLLEAEEIPEEGFTTMDCASILDVLDSTTGVCMWWKLFESLFTEWHNILEDATRRCSGRQLRGSAVHSQVHPFLTAKSGRRDAWSLGEALFSENGGVKRLWVFANSQDRRRIEILKERLFARNWPEHQHRRDLKGQLQRSRSQKVRNPFSWKCRKLPPEAGLLRPFIRRPTKITRLEWYLNIQKQPCTERSRYFAVAPAAR